MTRKLFTLAILVLTVGLGSCAKDDEDEKSQSGTFEATVDGTAYSYNLGRVSYSSGSQRLLLDANCDCPYTLQIRVLNGLAPRTLPNGEGGVDITFNDRPGQPKTGADSATVIIDSHNESAQTVTGSFNFSKDVAGNTIQGNGTFKNVKYE